MERQETFFETETHAIFIVLKLTIFAMNNCLCLWSSEMVGLYQHV